MGRNQPQRNTIRIIRDIASLITKEANTDLCTILMVSGHINGRIAISGSINLKKAVTYGARN